MKRRFKYCAECRRTLLDTEIESGRYAEDARGMFCVECAAGQGLPLRHTLPAAPVIPPPSPADPAPAVSEPPATPAQSEGPPRPRAAAASKPRARSKTAPFPAVPREAEPAPPPPHPVPPPTPTKDEASLADIARQLERIERILLFEKTSSWNVLAVVSQCLAVGLLVLAVLNWLESPTELLLAALICQTMALTFFVKAK